MDNTQAILLIGELLRAFGVDSKQPGDEVFSEQFRPEVRFLHINTSGNPAGASAAQRVTVPKGERWVFDWLACRGLSGTAGGNDAFYYLSVSDAKLVGQKVLPDRVGADADIRTTMARQKITTVFGVDEWVGFKPLIGVDDSGSEFAVHDFTAYPEQTLILQSDGAGAWLLGDQLETRARYNVFPEHLLNFAEAKRDEGPKPNAADAGKWNISKTGVF